LTARLRAIEVRTRLKETCPVCREWRELRKDGTIRRHRLHGWQSDFCPGSLHCPRSAYHGPRRPDAVIVGLTDPLLIDP
jgi:hypothetical protein